MQKNIYFDYCAFIILAILLLSVLLKNMFRGRLNRIYLILIVSSIATTAFDIMAVSLDNKGGGYIVEKYIAHTGYLLLHCLSIPLYIAYFIAMTGTWHMIYDGKFKKVKLLSKAFPGILIVILLVVNLFNHKMFYLNSEDEYTRGSWFILMYIVTAFYMLYENYLIIRYRKLLEFNRLISFVAGIMLLIIAVVVQYSRPELLLEMFASAVTLLFIFMMVQRPEDNLDTDTGFYRFGTYISDMRRSFMNNKPENIIMVNITNYGAIRDMLGYDEMKIFKRDIAAKLGRILSENRIIAETYYLGNGNFRIVMQYRSTGRIEELAEKINSFMRNYVKWRQMELNIVACVCVVRCPEDIQDIDSLIAFGYDLGIRFYTGEVLFAAEIYKKEYYDIMRDIDKIIESALLNKKFEMYYQPIYSINEKRFNSAEALIRLKDDKYGFISPELFIPAAEKSGAIHKIGDFVLEEVCSFIGSDEFKELGLDYIEINLSVVQCMQDNFSGHLMDILNKYKVSHQQVNLEITETAASLEQNTMMNNITMLYNEGLAFSLDDFGTGYSNMMRIASIPFQLIKLDKTFTRFQNNPRLVIVIENTIKMIKAMNMKIVVEGIETEEMLQHFSSLGCEYIQGYYFSKPIPKDSFIEFIQNSN